jgi:WD40 repeat protein
MIRLRITPDGQPAYLATFPGDAITIGADPSCDLTLAGPGISRQHLRLRRVDGVIHADDCGSSNGTYVARQRLRGPTPLAAGDEARIPGFRFSLVEEPGHAEQIAPPPPKFDARPIAARVAPSARSWRERPDRAHLLSGASLAEARRWRLLAERADPPVSAEEDALILASEGQRVRLRHARRVAAVAVTAAALVGVWSGRSVLAGGLAARSLDLRAIVACSARVAVASEERRCEREASRVAAEIDAQTLTGVRALGEAREALSCARGGANVPPLEQAIRDLLAETKGLPLARTDSAIIDAAVDESGCTIAWATVDGAVHLLRRCLAAPSRQRFDGGAPVRVLVFDPAEARLIAVDAAANVRTWNLTEPTPLPRSVRLERPPEDLGALALDPHGRVLALADRSAPTVHLYDLAADDPRIPPEQLPGLTEPLTHLSFGEDGSSALIGASGGLVRAWRLRGAQPQGKPRLISRHSEAVRALTVASCSPASGAAESWVVSGSDDGRVLAQPLAERRKGFGASLPLALREPLAVGLTDDCQQLVAAHGRALYLWQRAAKEPDRAPRELQQARAIEHMRLLSGGRALTIGASDLTVWDLRGAGAPRRSPGDAHEVKALAVAADLALTGGDDGVIRLWDLTTGAGWGASHAIHAAMIDAFSVDRAGARVLAAGGERLVLWSLGASGDPSQPSALKGHEARITASAIAPDATWAASADQDQRLFLWPLDSVRPGDRSQPVITGAIVDRIAFTDDSAWLVASGRDGACAIDLRGEGPRECQDLPHAGEVIAAQIIPGTARVLLGAGSGALTIIDLVAWTSGSGPASLTLEKIAGGSWELAVSADGRRLAAAGDRVVTWEMVPGAEPRRSPWSAPQRPQQGRQSLAWSPAGELLAIAADDRRIHLSRGADGESVGILEAPSGVTALAFADAKTLLVGGPDGSLRRWLLPSPATGDETCAAPISSQGVDPVAIDLRGANAPIRGLTVAAGGDLAITGGDGRTLHIWPISAVRLRARLDGLDLGAW